MGSANNKRWYNVIRDKILGRSDVSGSTRDDTDRVGGEDPAAVCSDTEVRAVPTDQREGTATEDVTYTPPDGPEDNAPEVLGRVSDGTSMMYVQTCFWVASYVRLRAERGDFTQDQLIEQFGVNVRRCIDPEWRADS